MVEGLYEKPLFRIAGDRGLLVEYGNAIDPVINRKVRSVAIALGRDTPPGVMEIMPTYRSVIIIYDPAVTAPAQLQEAVLAVERRLAAARSDQPRRGAGRLVADERAG